MGFNTGNPLPSKDILDLYDNSENIDHFANSQEDEHPDRFGTKRLTLAGLIKRSMALRNEINDFSGALTFKPEWSDVPMNVSEGMGGEGGALNLQAEALGNRSEINKVHSREALRRTYLEAGLTLAPGSFEEGGELKTIGDVLLEEKTGKAYGWEGSFPKVVPPKSSTIGFVDKSIVVKQRIVTTTIEIQTGIFKIGDLLEVTDRNNAKFNVISGVGNGFDKIHAGENKVAALVVNPDGVTPDQMGAVHDKNDQSEALTATFQFAANNKIPVTGSGVYWTAKTIQVIADVMSFATLDIRPLTEIRTGILNGQMVNVLSVTSPGKRIFGLRSQNSDAVPDTAGIHVLSNTTKMWSCQAVQHKYNIIVGSYSCLLQHCQGILGGTGLSVYGQSFTNECNACEIIGGEYYGNTDWALVIGDSRIPTAIPAGEFFGSKISIRGPTCDQGKIKIDRVLDVYCDVYCEQGGSTHLAAIELGGGFPNSLRGIEIANGFFAEYKYAVKCLGSVSDLSFHNNYLRGAFTCAVYLTSDQYSYSYHDNTTTNASFSGPVVHTGVRFGQSGNVFADKTIDVFDLNTGLQKNNGEHIYPNKCVYESGIQYYYQQPRYRYYKNPSNGVPGIPSGTLFTFSTRSDALNFNAGDAITFTGSGGGLSYVVSVNYEEGTLIYDSGTWVGGGKISKPVATPRVEFSTFQLPTMSGIADGSVAWNIFTVSQTPNFWIRKAGSWSV